MTKSAETSFSKKYELPQFSLKFINSSTTMMNEVKVHENTNSWKTSDF